jgi:hypothetical protein
MEDFRKRRASAPLPQEANRRRLGRVVHDDRGNAFLTWHDAPADEKREVLEILGDPKLKVKTEETFDPYARREARTAGAPGKPAKPKDLRKLGEWIKMMRELEARKATAGDED